MTVEQPSTAGRNGRARGSFDRERQSRSAYLVGVLTRALTAQIDELGRAAGPVPDGWWFTEPDAPAGTTGRSAPGEAR